MVHMDTSVVLSYGHGCQTQQLLTSRHEGTTLYHCIILLKMYVDSTHIIYVLGYHSYGMKLIWAKWSIKELNFCQKMGRNILHLIHMF